MPLQMDDTGKIIVFNIYFPYSEETNDAKLLLDPRRERLVVPKIQGLLPCNLKRTLGGPFACQDVLQAWEPACSLQRSGSQSPIANESRVAV